MNKKEQKKVLEKLRVEFIALYMKYIKEGPNEIELSFKEKEILISIEGVLTKVEKQMLISGNLEAAYTFIGVRDILFEEYYLEFNRHLSRAIGYDVLVKNRDLSIVQDKELFTLVLV